MSTPFRAVAALLLSCGFAHVVVAQDPPVDLLPDIIVDTAYLDDYIVVTNVEAGRTHMRFSNATANIGDGPVYVIGVEPPAKDDGEEITQEVIQRIYRSDDTYYERTAGQFTFHPEHNHVHVDDWSVYRLRAVLPNDGVGDVLATGEKISFCLLDSALYDASLPNTPDAGVFLDCGFGVQGISVGYEDVYSRFLPGQWIDITDIPSGVYWLESEVDPLNNMLEFDETNNIGRILVSIEKDDPPPPPQEGFFAWLRALIQQFIDLILSIFGGGNPVPLPEGKGLHIAL